MCFARPNTRDETPSRRHGAVTMADRQDVASKLALAFVLEAVKPIDSDTCDSMESDSDSCISDDTTDSIEQYQEHLIKSAREQLTRPRAQPQLRRLNCHQRRKRAEDYSDAASKRHFRWLPKDMRRLINSLCLPALIRSEQSGNTFDGETAFLIYMRRKCSTTNYVDLEEEFNYLSQQLAMASDAIDTWLDESWTHLIDGTQPAPVGWPGGTGLNRWVSQLPMWARAINVKFQEVTGAPMDPRFGLVCMFIDGIFSRIARPSNHGIFGDIQRAFYTGYKHSHGVIFQALIAPNGLFIDVWGPGQGRHNDRWLMRSSNMDARLVALCGAGGFTVYGDSIYIVSAVIRRAVRGLMVSAVLAAMCKCLNSFRTEVEHGFAKVYQLFPSFGFKSKIRLFGSARGISRSFRNAFFLANCHTCVYGNQTSGRFGLLPPTLEEYLRGGVESAGV